MVLVLPKPINAAIFTSDAETVKLAPYDAFDNPPCHVPFLATDVVHFPLASAISSSSSSPTLPTPPTPTWYVYLRGRSHLNLFEILCISHNTFQCCGSLAPPPSCCSAAICTTCAFRVHKRVPMAGETARLSYIRTVVMNDYQTP